MHLVAQRQKRMDQLTRWLTGRPSASNNPWNGLGVSAVSDIWVQRECSCHLGHKRPADLSSRNINIESWLSACTSRGPWCGGGAPDRAGRTGRHGGKEAGRKGSRERMRGSPQGPIISSRELGLAKTLRLRYLVKRGSHWRTRDKWLNGVDFSTISSLWWHVSTRPRVPIFRLLTTSQVSRCDKWLLSLLM